jgi:hypothetical protein
MPHETPPHPPSPPIPSRPHSASEASKAEHLRVEVADTDRISFSTIEAESPEMFSLRAFGGKLEIRVNRSHPATDLLFDNDRIHPAAEILLAAWATLESEAGSERRQEGIRDLRIDWSRVARRLARRREFG